MAQSQRFTTRPSRINSAARSTTQPGATNSPNGATPAKPGTCCNSGCGLEKTRGRSSPRRRARSRSSGTFLRAKDMACLSRAAPPMITAPTSPRTFSRPSSSTMKARASEGRNSMQNSSTKSQALFGRALPGSTPRCRRKSASRNAARCRGHRPRSKSQRGRRSNLRNRNRRCRTG